MKSFALNASKKTKSTTVGEIPVDWACSSFGDLVASTQYGLSLATHTEGATPILKMNSIANGKVMLRDLEKVHCSLEEVRKYAIRRGDILFNRTNSPALVGKTGIVQEDADVVFASYLVRFKLTSSSEPQFINYWFNSEIAQSKLKGIATSGVSQSNINPTRLKTDFPVPVPPLDEQRKISEILNTWDDALENLHALIEAQELRKKALMQQLLSGKRRLTGFAKKWSEVRLGEVAENVADQNKGRMGSASLYGVTKANGIVPMRDHVKGESFVRCKRLESDWFAYNPMRLNIGSIARWQGPDTVIVSGDYVVFRCIPGRLSPAYLDHLRRTWRWESFVTRGGNGSVRVRIYFSDLAEFTFPCPPIEEQEQIAKILDTYAAEISLLRQERDALELQKRGLMQKLLTGKVRVTP